MLKRFVPIVIVAAGVGGLAALAITRPQPQPLEADEKSWIVAAQTVDLRTLSPTLTLYARVDSPRIATLSAAIVADVIDVAKLEGERAEAGAVLVRLDDRDARLAVSQREAEVAEIRAELASERIRHRNDLRALTHEQRLLELARREVERAERMATRDLGSASQLDLARQAEARQALAVDSRRAEIDGHESRSAALEARARRAESQLAASRLDLERTTVRAPFTGRIASVAVSVGDRVRPGDRLMTLFDADRLELRAQIPTRYLPTIRSTLDAAGDIVARTRVDGVEVRARLDRLGAEVERGRGGTDALFRVHGEAPAALELGRTVELGVSFPPVEDVIALPAEALYGTDRVYALDGSRLRGVDVVRVGEHRSEDGERRILVRSAGLSNGDRVVTTQLPNAVDGLKVRVADEPDGRSRRPG